MATRPNSESAIAGHIQGLREAKAAFQALPEITRTRLLTATDTTLHEIVRHAKAKIESSPSIQTRNLLNAIGYTLNKNSGRGKAGVQTGSTTILFAHMGGITRKIKVKGIIMPGKNGGASGGRLDRPSRRAHFVEFGTRKMRAEPFMIPAAKSQEGPYADRCRQQGPNIERDMAAIGLRNL